MRVFLDTTVLIDLERKKENAESLISLLVKEKIPMLISIITNSELLVGAHFNIKMKNSVQKTKEFLEQFNWVELDGITAEFAAELMAYDIVENRDTKYQDIAIAASFISSSSDFLITDNKKHFDFPQLENKVYMPEEFLDAWKNKELKFT